MEVEAGSDQKRVKLSEDDGSWSPPAPPVRPGLQSAGRDKVR